ncbi:MAG: hypothetical protein RR365_11915, partial [Bacteroides sp.]
MAYEKDKDYQAGIEDAVKSGDYESAARLEQLRNEKISGEGITDYKKTSKYDSYLGGVQQERKPSNGSAPSYVSKYQSQIDGALNILLNRDKFSYDYTKDQKYKQYEKAYTENGKRAMEDTLAQVSARTGGLASSYAGAASQQSYNRHMDALSAKIPELEQLAYSMYRDEGSDQRANL